MLLLLTGSMYGQQDTSSNSVQTISLTKKGAKENIVFNIDASDSLSLAALDSVMLALDTLINDLKPASLIYGHSIFDVDSAQVFQSGTAVKVPDNYVLGNGDELGVTIFGISQYDAKLTIDDGGFIHPSEMPRILLRGLTWKQAKELLARRYRSYYVFRPEQIAVVLTAPRKITVNVFGEVQHPGSYTMLATNTAFNALAVAGGPTELGSVRKILITDGDTQRTMDIYQLMTKPISQFDYYLGDNVYIQVPTSSSIVTAEGAIHRPMKYELLPGESLTDLINYAGGLAPDAVRDLIQVKRYEGGRQRLSDINLSELLSTRRKFELSNGDHITFRKIEQALDNAVFAEGAVRLAGEFELESTPRLSDLISKSSLTREARMDIAFLQRLNPDSTYQLIELDLNQVLNAKGGGKDPLLEAGDKLIVMSQSSYAIRSEITVTGAVSDSLVFPFDPTSTITIQRAILLAGGMSPEAADEGYIIRTDINNPKAKEYLLVNLREALDNPSSVANLQLEPLDEIRVLESSRYTDSLLVNVRGAVRETGAYIFDESLRLKDALLLSGGLTDQASGVIDIYRADPDADQTATTNTISIKVDDDLNIIEGPVDFQLLARDEIVPRSVPEFEEQAFVEITGEVKYPGEYALLTPNESVQDLIKRAGGLSTEAFVDGIDISRLVENAKHQRYKVVNINGGATLLKADDLITIPKQQDVVYISLENTRAKELFVDRFENQSQMAVPYTPGKCAKWYIEEYAAGYGRDADKRLTTVSQASGAVSKVKGGWPFRKWPKPLKGATIVIGAKDKIAKDEMKKDEDTNVYQKLETVREQAPDDSKNPKD